MSQISEASFNMLLSRIRKAPRPDWGNKFIWQIFGHSNPQESKGWIYDKFKRNPKPNFKRIIAPTTENYHLPQDFVQNLKDTYSEEYFAINVLGKDDDSDSLLAIKGFNEDVLVDETLKINPQFPIHLTCDFNIDPMCWYICQDYGDQTYILYEFVVENTDTQSVAHIVCDTLKNYKNHQIIINGDASGKNRTTTGSNYDMLRRVLAEEGFYNHKLEILSKNPSIEWRINQFNAWMQDSQGKHHIKVHPQCKYLIYNFNNVEIQEGTSKPKIPSTGALRSDPKKKYLIHPIDAVSYLVCTYHRTRFESAWAEYNNADVGTDVFGGKYDKRLI
jgi:hypothetical protein